MTSSTHDARPGTHDPATMPTDISGKLSAFDKFATHADNFASRAWFFAFCVVLVVVWAPSFFLFGSVDTWQLIINTITTIVTFLLVALLQNTQKRADDAVQHKLNAIAEGMANLMGSLAGADNAGLKQDRRELLAAVGLEDREGA
jgi:low affinity Fe/Cu permease